MVGEQKPATEDGLQIRDMWPGVEAGNEFALDRSIQPESNNKVQYFLISVITFQICVEVVCIPFLEKRAPFRERAAV